MQTKATKINPILHFLTAKHFGFLRHTIFITAVAFIFNILTPETIKIFAEKFEVPFVTYYIIQIFNFVCSLLLIYFNLYYLFPKYFKKGLYFDFIIGILLVSILFFFSTYFTQFIDKDFDVVANKYSIKLTIISFLESIIFPIVFLSATTGYKVFKEWISDQDRFAALEKAKLNAELSQLKSQVNPHFLFNTLNNLNVLILVDPQKASNVVLGLSDVLRFQIYDSQQEKIQLSKDIEIIEQYLELEKIRRDNLSINVEVKGSVNHVFIPPLLFINFIDNAIKHSFNREKSFINLRFEIVDKFLHFEINNSKSIGKYNIEKNGLGLENVKKRIDLIYGDSYTLEMIDEEMLYKVKLKIPI